MSYDKKSTSSLDFGSMQPDKDSEKIETNNASEQVSSTILEKPVAPIDKKVTKEVLTKTQFELEFKNAVEKDSENKYQESIQIYKSILDKQYDFSLEKQLQNSSHSIQEESNTNPKSDADSTNAFKISNFFENSLLSKKQSSEVSFNLALAYYKSKDFSKSYLYNEKAIIENPYLFDAKQLKAKLSKEFQIIKNPNTNAIESVNNLGLQYLPLALLFFVFSFGFIYLLYQCRQFFVQWMTTPKFLQRQLKWPKSILGTFAFLTLVLFLTIFKWLDQTKLKGMIIPNTTFVYALPTLDSSKIFELNLGALIYVEQIKSHDGNYFYHIKRLDGQSGWVAASDILLIQ